MDNGRQYRQSIIAPLGIYPRISERVPEGRENTIT